MKKKILNIGSITKDTVITGNSQYTQIGGAVYYQLSTLNTLKIDSDSIILMGEDEPELLREIPSQANVHPIIRKNTMRYTNIYTDDKRRVQKAYFPKDTIEIEDLKKLDINPEDYFKAILSPLSPYEIDFPLIKYLKDADIETTLLIQGYIRHPDKYDNVTHHKWENHEKYLEYADIISSDYEEFETAFDVKINDCDMKAFIEENSLKMAIITKGSDGSAIYTKDDIIEIPAVKTDKIVDSTGLGDTYISAFIAKKDESTLFNAGLYASICAKNKLENRGALKTSKNKIEKEYKIRLNDIGQNNKWNYDGQ
ncbi:MAG: PfkB family carbohydrate kinase [Methanosphaera sp.]|nr:PfkB family carbohydrate kinase [Methanosphaera sp.]